MTKFIYTSHEGQTTTIDAEPGESVMRAATVNGVPGVVGECGGVLSCATCHVFVHAEDFPTLGELSDLEEEMLDGTAVDREATSRLSCQLHASSERATIRVTTPEYQE